MSKAWMPFARNEENVPGVFSLGAQKPFRRSQTLIRLRSSPAGE